MVEGGGFEPPKLARQIYSLIPLATREPLRKAAYCPDGPPPCQPLIPIKLLTYAPMQNMGRLSCSRSAARGKSGDFMSASHLETSTICCVLLDITKADGSNKPCKGPSLVKRLLQTRAELTEIGKNQTIGPDKGHEKWSWREESNPRPADYKSAALPTELRQPCSDRDML